MADPATPAHADDARYRRWICGLGGSPLAPPRASPCVLDQLDLARPRAHAAAKSVIFARAMALDAIDPFNVKRVLERVGRAREDLAAAADSSFLMNARRVLLPLPLVDRPEPVPVDVLP